MSESFPRQSSNHGMEQTPKAFGVAHLILVRPKMKSLVCCLALITLSSCSRRPFSAVPVATVLIENDPQLTRTLSFGDEIAFSVKIRNPTSHPVALTSLGLQTETVSIGQGCSTSSGGGKSVTIPPGQVHSIDCRFYVGPYKDNIDPNRFIKVRFLSPLGDQDVAFEKKYGDILFGLSLSFVTEGTNVGRIYLARYHVEEALHRAKPYFTLGLQ